LLIYIDLLSSGDNDLITIDTLSLFPTITSCVYANLISSEIITKSPSVNSNSNSYSNLLVFFGLIAYTFTGFCVYRILNYGNLVVLNIIWHLVYFGILFIIGFLIFKEKINYQKIIALIFG
jgi:drug/metabolite transporter (DMT)-like permease